MATAASKYQPGSRGPLRRTVDRRGVDGAAPPAFGALPGGSWVAQPSAAGPGRPPPSFVLTLRRSMIAWTWTSSISMFVRTLDIHQSPITNHAKNACRRVLPLDVKLLSPRAPSSDLDPRVRPR